MFGETLRYPMSDVISAEEQKRRDEFAAAVERGEEPPELKAILERFDQNVSRMYSEQGKQGIVEKAETFKIHNQAAVEGFAKPPSLEGLPEETRYIIENIKPGQYLEGNQAMKHSDGAPFTLEELANAMAHQAVLSVRSCTPDTPQRVVEGTMNVLASRYSQFPS